MYYLQSAFVVCIGDNYTTLGTKISMAHKLNWISVNCDSGIII